MQINKDLDSDVIQKCTLKLSDRINLIVDPNHKNKTIKLTMHDNISNIIDLSEDINNEDLRQIVIVLSEIWRQMEDNKNTKDKIL